MQQKIVFRQDSVCVYYGSLGDTVMRMIALYDIIHKYDLDAIIIPQENPHILPLWKKIFGDRVVTHDTIPFSHKYARQSCSMVSDCHYSTVCPQSPFERVYLENGFFNYNKIHITPPIIYKCNPNSNGIMIYPKENTDGNRTFNRHWWIDTIQTIHNMGYVVNVWGHCEPLDKQEVDNVFPLGLDGLEQCLNVSCMSIGGNTGPSWALLLSDIPQIVLESKSVPICWHFDRACDFIYKKFHVYKPLDILIKTIFI